MSSFKTYYNLAAQSSTRTARSFGNVGPRFILRALLEPCRPLLNIKAGRKNTRDQTDLKMPALPPCRE